MSEQRWTAPETGWYRYDSAQGFPLEYLGREQPDDDGAQHYFEGMALMNSGGADVLTGPRPTLTVLVDWDTVPR